MPISDAPGVKQLQVRAGEDGDAYIVRLIGELDLNSCEDAERALVQAEASEAARIVLDIDGLRFIDSAGLELLLFLLRAKHRDDEASGRLRVTRGTGQVADMLHLTTLDQTLACV